MRRLLRPLLLGAPALLLLCLGAPNDGRAGDPATVTVSGTVQFLGDAPAPSPVTITQDIDYCGKTALHNENLLVSASKGLANVVVYVQGVTGGKAAVPGVAKLDNTRCRYEPHVVAMVVGSELQIGNNDPILHNTHARLPKADVFNVALPMEGQVIERTIDKMGLMKVGCDAGHDWMSAWIATFDHPYFAVTAADGTFSIPDLPPGEYTLVTWHEKLGKRTQVIQATGGDLGVDLAYQ